MYQKFIVLFTLISLTLARSAPTQINSIDNDETIKRTTPNGISSYMNDIKFLYKTYKDCTKIDTSTCLKLKLVSTLDSAFRSVKDVHLMDGITFVQDQNAPIDETPVKSESEIEENLPRSLDDKESALNGLIINRIISFFKTHTLQIKFPSAEEYQRSLTEGRKKKGNGSMIMIPLLLGGTFIPLAFGALALLAGKALIVSKLALVLSSIIGIKKLLSGNHHGHEGHEVVVSGGHGHSGWGRNYELHNNLAYNAYVPTKN